MSKCRSCQAPIRWIRTAVGKPMPLDFAPSPNGNVRHDGEMYTSHFATCPDAKRWRKREGGDDDGTD